MKFYGKPTNFSYEAWENVDRDCVVTSAEMKLEKYQVISFLCVDYKAVLDDTRVSVPVTMRQQTLNNLAYSD